jgi:hypothetical protein
MKMTRTALMALRLAAVFQLIVGAALWSGKWYPILDLHRTVGVIYVICLWIICGAALSAKRKPALAAIGIVWGLVIAGFGFSQVAVMPGDNHNMVRVAHLLVSLLALPIAEILAKGSSTANRNG